MSRSPSRAKRSSASGSSGTGAYSRPSGSAPSRSCSSSHWARLRQNAFQCSSIAHRVMVTWSATRSSWTRGLSAAQIRCTWAVSIRPASHANATAGNARSLRASFGIRRQASAGIRRAWPSAAAADLDPWPAQRIWRVPLAHDLGVEGVDARLDLTHQLHGRVEVATGRAGRLLGRVPPARCRAPHRPPRSTAPPRPPGGTDPHRASLQIIRKGCGTTTADRSQARHLLAPPRVGLGHGEVRGEPGRRRQGEGADRRPPVPGPEPLGRRPAPRQGAERVPEGPQLGRVRRLAPRPHRRRRRRDQGPLRASCSATSAGCTGWD